MPSVLILGGTGMIGRAVARRFLEAGWKTVVASRSGSMPEGLEASSIISYRVDRRVDGELERALGDGVDVLVDVIAFTQADADQLNSLHGRIGTVVAVSSASVYADAEGHTLDEATSIETFPDFRGPIAESAATVQPGDKTYSTQKMAMERNLLNGPIEATIVRPAAVYGPGATLPRELYFVRRVIDGRHTVVLVNNGASQFHTTSVHNLSELIACSAEHPGKRILNCGDPDPPTVSEIGRAIGSALGYPFEEVLLAGSRYELPQFANPWAVPSPVILDMRAAEREVGYKPVRSYQEAMPEMCAWLLNEAAGRDWSQTYLSRYFDYAAEDALLARRTR